MVAGHARSVPLSRCRRPRAARAGSRSPSAVGVQEVVERCRVTSVPAAIAGADPDLAVEGEAPPCGRQAGPHEQGELRRKGLWRGRPAMATASSSSRAMPEGQLLAVHAAHPWQAPVHRQDEQGSSASGCDVGRARPDRKRLELGLAERGSHNQQSKPLVDSRVKYGVDGWPRCWSVAYWSLVCGFAALSSSVAAALGLEEERISAFTGLISALLLLPFMVRPRLGTAERSPSPAGPPGRQAFC